MAAFEIVRACYDVTQESILLGRFIPTIFIHDEFLGDVLIDEHLQSVIKEIQRLMVSCMRVITPDVVAGAEVALMYRWSKYADPCFDDAGNLIPWEPEK